MNSPLHRDEHRLAGHTNEEQRSSVPVCAAPMGHLFMEIVLNRTVAFKILCRHLASANPQSGADILDYRLHVGFG